MKPIIPFALLGALLAVGAADAAATDPVGYISHTIAGTGGSGSALTLLSPSLVQPTEFAGQTSVNPSGLSTITFTGGVPATLNSSYVLEIPSSGWWSTVVSSTATSITLNDALPAGLPANTAVTVRKHNTVQSLFGENAPGLAAFNGESGDEVQFLTPAGVIISVSYVPGAVTETATDDWYELATSSLANDMVIEPGSAVIVKTSSSVNLTFTSSGSVKTTPTQVDVFPGLTLIGQPDAVGATLGDMNLATQMVQFDGENSNFDEFQFLTAAQVVDGNVSLAPSLGGPTMGNLGTSESSNATLFGEGKGAIFKRDAGGTASVLTFPGSTVQP